MKQILIICIWMFFSCSKETYRNDKTNQLTKKAKKSQNFLGRQAHELTSENIENRDKNVKNATKEKEKQQKELNKSNSQISKVTKKGTFTGELNIY